VLFPLMSLGISINPPVLIDRVSLYGVGPNKKPRERTSHRIHFSMLVGWQGRKMIAVYY